MQCFKLMSKNLIIVESPAKAKTIEKFLGPDYKVMSSFGHIRDLRKKDFSIDVDSNYEPIYEIPAEKKELVSKLRAEAEKADTVWLASDEDREGEAIAWHLAEVLNLDPATTHRIVFHEITKPAIVHALENPRTIDLDRVNAQQARRVLDRIVGFELSPVLWRKIKPALSAGRVQSVAVRLICEREKEIAAFTPQPFFRVTGSFGIPSSPAPLRSELNTRLESEQEALQLLEACKEATFTVEEVTVKPINRSPAPPFTTSTLQQEAARKLGFTVSQTMRVAQQLYEAGHITYMRTDSLNLSDLAIKDISSLVTEQYGEEYLHVRHYHTKSKGAQEAHEAIRPTYVANRDIEGTPQEKRLYHLIRMRTLASQMADARIEKTTLDISITPAAPAIVCDGKNFVAHGEVIKFEGFLKAYAIEGEGNAPYSLPSLPVGTRLSAETITATERFTQAPARYNEASLVKKMEELGIGRPSTYAPTISTIQSRDYVERGEKEGVKREYKVITLTPAGISTATDTETTGSDKGRLVPTDIGMVVNDFLTEYFPDILDYNFTARIEEKFDEVAEGSLGWHKEIDDFYKGFHPDIQKINTMRMEHKVGERALGTDPKTGRPVSVKIGRFGPMVQIGSTDDEEKPQFASLLDGQSIATITLDEALKLFELPRTLGDFEGKTVVAAIGRFGPYIRHDSKFVSIPKELTPQGITLQQAIELIEKKRADDASKIIKDFPEVPGLQALNGRFGPYLAFKPLGAKKAVNYKLPKGTDAASLTAEEAQKIMKEQDEAPAKPRATRKKAAKK